MKKTISLKYKLLLVLLFIPTVTSAIYYVVAKNIFEKDKFAYIYEASLQSTKSVADEILSPIQGIDKIVWYVERFYDQLNDSKVSAWIKESVQEIPLIANLTVARGSLVLISTDKPTADKNRLERDQNATIFLNENNQFTYQRRIQNEYFLNMQFDQDSLNEKLKNTPFDGILIFNSNKQKLSSTSSEVESLVSAQLDQLLDVGEGLSAKMLDLGENKKYILSSFKSQATGLVVLCFYSWEKALLPIKDLTYQSLLFFIIVASLTIVLSLFLSSRLTSGLKKLTEATAKVSEENYNFEIEVNSSDEIGVLAGSFMQMSRKVKSLMNELRRYNEQLEAMVEKRTKQLSDANRVQKAIMDSVDQGFSIFDHTGTLKTVPSKSANQHFGVQMKANSKIYSVFSKVLGIADLENLFKFIFDETLPFEDCAGLLPAKMEINNRHIFFKYFPYYLETGAIDGLVVVTSDKTEEVKAIEQNKREAMKSQMILSVTNSSGQFKTVLKQTHEVIQILKEAEKYPVGDIFIEVHTIKASLLVFGMYDHSMVFHSVEDLLSGVDKISPELAVQLKEKAQKLEELFNAFFKEFGETFGLLSFDSLDAQLAVKLEREEFMSFIKKLEQHNNKLAYLVMKQIFSVRADKFCEFYRKLAHDVANRQGKKIEFIANPEQKILDYGINKFKAVLVHVFSNAVNHGIEAPSVRVERGKPEMGKIAFNYMEDGKYKYFIIQDDGGGIDAEKIRKKLLDNGVEEAHQFSEEKLQSFIFEESFSTNETVDTTAGRGVGMAAVKQEIDAAGGEIIIETVLGKGTTFKFKLPLV